jgi:hypothetical protein
MEIVLKVPLLTNLTDSIPNHQEPPGPSGQGIGIRLPALRTGFDPLIYMVRYEGAFMQVDYTFHVNGIK